MKIGRLSHPNDFLAVVNECKGGVWLKSTDGDIFNLKSLFSQYLGVGALLSEHGDKLELSCTHEEDERLFSRFFRENPEAL